MTEWTAGSIDLANINKIQINRNAYIKFMKLNK